MTLNLTHDLPWCLRAATAADPAARLPFTVDGRRVGSVARAHLPALRAWPQWLQLTPDRVNLVAAPAERDSALDQMHRQLQRAGLLRGWRDECFALFDPDSLLMLARIERAAARFWGLLTLGAHATGYVADEQGRPTHLWIAQRAADKATDPGLFDNLVGGGVPWGQTPAQALRREAFEEAGLQPAELDGVQAAGVLRLQRDVPEGHQHEWLVSFDLALPPGRVPVNQDGEVAGFRLMPVADALALGLGRTMTVDAALVTLDFALRHGLADSPGLAAGLQALRVTHRRV